MEPQKHSLGDNYMEFLSKERERGQREDASNISIGDHQELKKELASVNLKLIAYRDELKKLQIENALLIKLIKGTV